MTPDELALALEEKRPEMLRLTTAMLRGTGLEHDAEDFLQDASIKILAGLAEGRYTFDDGVGGLFQTAIINLIHDRRDRVDHRRAELTDEYTRIYQPDSQAHIRQREQLNLDVANAFHQLDERTGQIVRLTWMEEQTNRQVQEQLHMAPNTIVEGLTEALPVLQRALARYDHRTRPTTIHLPIPLTPAERKAVAMSIRKDRRARQAGLVTTTVYRPDGTVLSVTVQTPAAFRRARRLASQDPYKKEAGETDSPMPSGGNGAEIVLTETDRRYEHEENVLLLIDAIFGEEVSAGAAL